MLVIRVIKLPTFPPLSADDPNLSTTRWTQVQRPIEWRLGVFVCGAMIDDPKFQLIEPLPLPAVWHGIGWRWSWESIEYEDETKG